MQQTNEIDRARDALYSIPPDLPRDRWHRVGRTAIANWLSMDDIIEWSRPAHNFKSEQDVRAAFRTITPEGGTGAGTLFRIAAEYGWTEGDRPTPRPAKARTRPAEPPRKPTPSVNAEMVWGRCTPTTAHAYAVKKGASPEAMAGLRVVPVGDTLRILNESMVGALVLPVTRADGTLSTLQLIPPPEVAARLKAQGKPGKLNLPGCPVEGWFTVGELAAGGVAYVCEGIGAGWSCWQATGCAAVVCFGVGNTAKVARALRQQDESARLVLVADRGKEKLVQDIAADVAGTFVLMPECEENNFDANDLFLRDGFDVLAALLEAATAPPKPEPKVHPLARFVDIDGAAKPPRWVLPGFVGHGVTVIAGAHGVGKTSALLPLAMTAAGLHGDDLMPREWRHVIYVTEDLEQARRILAGVTLHSNLSIDLGLVRERVHIVEAVRLDPAFVASVGATYREQFTRIVQGVEVLPLVVLDTKSAVLALDNENDNSEASRMMAALKQGFDRLPVWLIGHVAKANLTRNDALTSRGASAIEGDANQTMFLIREGENRYLVQGKTRFEARWAELEITSYTSQTTAPDEFGNMETVMLRWGIAAPAQQSCKEASNQAAEQRQAQEAAQLRDDVREAVDVAWLAGHPLSKSLVRGKVNAKQNVVVACIESLLAEGWLYEVEVPSKQRTNPTRSRFLVNLSTVEHESYIGTGIVPSAKTEIPQSWLKPPKEEIPSVPEAEADSAKKEAINESL